MKKKELRIILDLHRAAHQIGVYIDGLKGVDLTQAEAIVLAFLHERRKATMSELHRAFGHKRSTLTNIVDRLVTRGLATRHLRPDDRRSIIVMLSRTGTTLASQLYHKLAAFEVRALENISDRDVDLVRKLIRRLDVDKRLH